MKNNEFLEELFKTFWKEEVLKVLPLVADLYSRKFEELEYMHSLAKSENIKSIIKNIMDLKIKWLK